MKLFHPKLSKKGKSKPARKIRNIVINNNNFSLFLEKSEGHELGNERKINQVTGVLL